MNKADSKIFIAYEDPDSLSAISKFEVFPGAMAWVPDQEKAATVNFSEFWVEKSWANAVTAATGAGMIIVSLSGHMDLPVPVRRWMESWPNYEKANRTALVVVFGAEPADAFRQNGLLSYFRQIAENHGLDFVCNCDGAKNFPAATQPSEPANVVELPRPERYPAFNSVTAPTAA